MSSFTLRGVHVAWGMAAFFGVIVSVNTAFITLALSTFPGEEAPRAYVSGLKYNETLARRRAQTALGWRAGAELAQGQAGPVLRLRVRDGAGAALQGAQIAAELRRPAVDGMDQPLAFRALGEGLYEAALPADLAPGAWRLRGVVRRGGAEFAVQKELAWSPQPRS